LIFMENCAILISNREGGDPVEIRVLQYFLAVAREQSISAAAQSLHLSQPTLSTQLKALEQELGHQLLIRGTKGSRKVTLTEEGMILRKRAEEILTLVDKAQEEIAHGDGVVEGEVSIGAGETDTVRLFARAVESLRRQHPGIRLRISSGNSIYVLEQLDKGLIDFGLLFGEVDPHKYQSLTLPTRDVWGVLMRRDSPLADKESISPQDLWDKPLILSHQRGGGVFQWLGREPSQLQVVATYNLVYNASLLVDEGLGYALCFDKLINTQGSSLVFRPLEPPMWAEAHVVWKKYQVFSKAARLFLEELTGNL
jgi:DNA-binding transcriptional LysR family regulator